MKLNMLLLAGAAFVATASQSQAQLYNNPVDVNGKHDCVYNTTCGAMFTGNTYAAQAFSLSSAATVGSVGFTALVGDTPGTSANYFFLGSNEGTPGAILAQGSALLTNTANENGFTDYRFNFTPLSLSAGNYFVAFQNVTGSFSDYLAQGVTNSGAFESDNGGLIYTPGYGGVGREIGGLAVSVNAATAVAAVPEPASWAMMILGMGAVGFAMRRRSKVRTTVSYAV